MVSALIVAAGRGTRMGPDVDKLFLPLLGRPIVAHTVKHRCPRARSSMAAWSARITVGPSASAVTACACRRPPRACRRRPAALPQRWRLLEGMIATAGLLGFAWSTGVLLTLAQDFQEQQMQRLKDRRAKPND